MFVRLCLLAMVLVTAGCPADNLFVRKTNEPVDNVPLIQVEPRLIEFGELASDELDEATITISSTGYRAVEIDEVRLLSAEGGFELVSEHTFPLDLAPGDDPIVMTVRFSPSYGGDLTTQVVILSDADNEPEIPVDLFGRGAVPQLLIEPSTLDFGEHFVPCGAVKEFTLTNVGTEPLDIEALRLEESSSLLTVVNELPEDGITLSPGTSWRLQVDFDASVEGTAEGRLAVDSNDPAGTRTADIVGLGRYASRVTKQIDVPPTLPVNILFALDRSCSMSDNLNKLTQNIGSFADVLDAASADWTLGVVTDANGCFRQGVIRPATGWKSQFTTAVSANQQDTTEQTETGLGMTQTALSKAVPGGCNDGWRTTGAPMHLIMISDERDQTSGWGQNAGYWTTIVNGFQVFGGSSPTRVHSIVDLARRARCSDSPGSGGIDFGPAGYLDATNATGGKALEICTANWANDLADIARLAVDDLSRFSLGQTRADVDTLEVSVNGTVVTTGWTYDEATNSLLFDPPAPGGAVIDATFGVSVNCRN